MPSVASRYASEAASFERPSARQEESLRAPVVLMVSGGADSTALLLLAATSTLDIQDGRGEARIARERLHVLHVNHQLRGIDAKEDEEFVQGMADRFGIPCTIERVDVARLAQERFAGNIENAGREVRYAVATRLANELSEQAGTPRSAARILTAHTANDSAETFLMNAIRGSGAAGLSSIPRRRNRIVRPLLDRTHEELCELLRMNGIIWREDETNSDTRYLRAFVRHEIIPLAEQRNPRVVSSIANGCEILSEEDAFMTQLASKALRSLERRRTDASVTLDAARLAATEVAIARRVVRQAILSISPECRLESRHVTGILKLVAAGEGSLTIPMGIDARVEYGMLFLRTRASVEEAVTGWVDVPGQMALGGGRVLVADLRAVPHGQDPTEIALERARRLGNAGCTLDATACSVADDQASHLFVDGPQQGDVLCPLGMHGQSKKVSDLLNEAKVPAAERPGVSIVRVSATGPIVWVAGIRADERFKVTPATRLLLELEIRRTSG